MNIHVSIRFYLIRQIQGENNIQMWCTCKYACDVFYIGKDRIKLEREMCGCVHNSPEKLRKKIISLLKYIMKDSNMWWSFQSL